MPCALALQPPLLQLVLAAARCLSAWIPVKATMGTEASWQLCKQSGLAPGSLPFFLGI